MTALGQGRYDCFLADRGGGTLLGRINGITRVHWTRARDDISVGNLTVETPGPACAKMLANAHSARDEIVIMRNGKRVWEGPITLLEFSRSTISIEAHDLLWYASRRALNYHWNYSHTNAAAPVLGTNAVTALTQLLQTVYTVADSEHYRADLYPIHGPNAGTPPDTTDPKTKSDIPAYSRSVWDILDQYGDNGGIDYVVAGRRIYIFNTHLNVFPLQRMGDADFKGSLVVTEYGSLLETRRFITDNNGSVTYGEADAATLAYYGPIEKIVNRTDEDQDQNGSATPPLKNAAISELLSKYPAPTLVRVPDNTALDPKAQVDINDLIPGAMIPVYSTLTIRTVEQLQKLDTLSVEVVDGNETISVTMSQAPQTVLTPP